MSLVNMAPTKHFFMSPHLDDAVSACGGLIAKLRAENAHVELITFFQKRPNLDEIPRLMRVFADYTQRLEENRKALELLDVENVTLEFFERAFVKPYLKTLLQVFFSPPGGSSQYLDFDKLVEAIRQIANQNPDDESRFYFPMGIGNHYDHTRLFFAAIKVMEETQRFRSFRFYEDAYCLMGNAILKKHWIARQYLNEKSKDLSRTSLKSRVMSFALKTVMDAKSIDAEMKAISEKYAWKVQREQVGEYLDKKMAALFFYTSQIKALGGERMVKKLYPKYHEFWGQAEPYWYVEQEH